MKTPTKKNPSPLYLQCLAEAREHHRVSKTYSGKFLRPHAPFIKDMIERLGCTSILDYGCGKGAQYEWISHGDDASIPGGMTIEQYWGCNVFRFDPAYPPYSLEPPAGRKFDLVICTHALGSVPVVDLPWVVDEIYDRANKGVYIAEKLGEVRKQVFLRPGDMPRNWTARQWAEVLSVPGSIGLDVILATRAVIDGAVISERRKL